MTERRKPSKTCGAENPDEPGMKCERELCVQYHRNGQTVWTEGAQPLPRKKTDPVRMAGVVRRTRDKARKEREQ